LSLLFDSSFFLYPTRLELYSKETIHFEHQSPWVSSVGVCFQASFGIHSIKYLWLTSTDDSQKHHENVYGQKEHEGKLSHEVIAGAASFAAFKAFEDHRRSEGLLPTTPLKTKVIHN
jgi:hypothetical protein